MHGNHRPMAGKAETEQAALASPADQATDLRIVGHLAMDEKGNFLVFFGISVAVLFGTVALSFDLGRMAAVQTDLQSFADSVALASAAELDGEGNSIDRAIQAAALVTDTQSFALGGRDLTSDDYSLTFLTALPEDDSGVDLSDDIVCSGTGCVELDEEDQSAAIFVRVDVEPHDLPLTFASVLSVMGGGQTLTGHPEATATAGFTQYACDIAPLTFCLPQDGSGPAELARGTMVTLVQGGSGKWGPGNFGFLDVTDAYDDGGPCGDISGEAPRARCLLGAINAVTQCYSIRGVNTDPGHSVGITVDPFNFRFDIFAKNDAEADDEDFAPAPNVIYGQQPTITLRTRKNQPTTIQEIDHCSPVADGEGTTETSLALPRGADMASADPDAPRFGAPDTFTPDDDQRRAYMQLNWGVSSDPFPDALTRWDVYREEIRAIQNGRILQPMRDSSGNPVLLRDDEGNLVLDANGQPVNVRQETGLAQCSGETSTDPYRRVVIAAAIDCTANPVVGRATNVPVETFYQMFLTEPVRENGGGDLAMHAEVIGEAGGRGSGSTSNGIFRDVVQLYR